MSIELKNPRTLHPAPGFSHIAIASGTRVVFFAGQVALNREFQIIGDGDLYAQTVAAMRNLEMAMLQAECSWGDVARRTIYTTHPTEFELIARAIAEVTGGAADPPQTIVGVTSLVMPGLLIEIEATAVR